MPAVFFFASLSVSGQWELDGNYDITFDNNYGLNHLAIDTVSNPNNIWQIGTPQKNLFANAASLPSAIVTDTLNPFPINDTSIFIIKNQALEEGFLQPQLVILSGKYYVNSDSLTDYGKIEFSPDNGLTWIDLLNDTIKIDSMWTGSYYQPLYWFWNSHWATSRERPILTGNSNGWKEFGVRLSDLGPYFNIEYGDTVLY